jgi:phage baseplate assembly protein W
MMPGTLILLETRVTDCLNNFEPRCDLIAVDVTASIEGNSVEITVVFSVLNIEEPQTVTIGIDRVR